MQSVMDILENRPALAAGNNSGAAIGRVITTVAGRAFPAYERRAGLPSGSLTFAGQLLKQEPSEIPGRKR
jgi:hypothetical protein